jgi:quercetin dioxygenase-like cupin family protein
MQVIRRQEAIRSGEPDHFTGPTALERYSGAVGGYLVSLVTFEQGSSTRWHCHPRGQVLYVVSGAGFVEEAGDVRELAKGDLAIADPWIRHRHGASSRSPMSHLSVTQEVAQWLE